MGLSHVSVEEIEISEQNQRKLLDDINRLRSLLIIDVPFTMPIIKFKINFVKLHNALMGTNGLELFIDPDRWNKMDEKQKLFCLFHEWFHIVNLHSRRLGSRSYRLWCFATDFVINYFIISDVSTSKMQAPKGILYDVHFRNMNSEEAYAYLEKAVADKKESMKNKNEVDVFSYKNNVVVVKKDSSKQESKDDFVSKDQAVEMLAFDSIAEDVFYNDLLPSPVEEGIEFKYKDLLNDIVKSAEMHRKMKGNLPSYYSEMIDSIRRSQVDWKRIFHSLFKEVSSTFNDRSYSKPKKWGWQYNIIIPSEIGLGKINVALIVDTSGSMEKKEFEQVAGELQKMLPLIDKLHLVSADAEVHEIVKVRSLTDVIGNRAKFKFKGRGGTNFVPALHEVAKLKVDLVIYYTDGYGSYGKSMPKGIRNLLWVLTNYECPKPPFGKTLVIN